MTDMEQLYSDIKIINSLWYTFLDRAPPEFSLFRIDGELGETIGKLTQEDVKTLNEHLITCYDTPLITKFFLENVAACRWALPSQIAEPLRGYWESGEGEFKRHILETLNTQATSPRYSGLNEAFTYTIPISSIGRNEKGISILSGQEAIRAPFLSLNAEKTYLVDTAYETQVIPLDKPKIKEKLRTTTKENLPKSRQRQMLLGRTAKIAKAAGAYCEGNSLLLHDTKKRSTFYEYITNNERFKRQGAEQFAFVQGNAEDLDNLELIEGVSRGNLRRKKLEIEDNSLDFGIAINLDWMQGDVKEAIKGMIKKLNDRSTLIISFQTDIIHMIPYMGTWGLLGNFEGSGITLLQHDFKKEISKILEKESFEVFKGKGAETDYVVTILARRS